MDSSNFSLFKDNSNVVAMPTVTEETAQEQSKLASQDISGMLKEHTVKTLLLPEDTVIAKDNYIFDFSADPSVDIFQKAAIKSLLARHQEQGDISLYLYNKKGLVYIGKGDSQIVDGVIPIMVNFILNEDVKVYKNFSRGNAPEEVKALDITTMRLNL